MIKKYWIYGVAIVAAYMAYKFYKENKELKAKIGIPTPMPIKK